MSKVKELTEKLKNPLNESSLSRIFQKSQEFECVTISAFRGKNTKDVNKMQTARMLKMLKALDYSVTTIIGQYEETQEDGTNKLVKETSFFVANHKNDPNFLDQMKKLGELFDQDSICVIEKGFKSAYLFGTNKTGWLGYHKVDKFNGVSIDTIEKKYFSAIGGKSFQFKAIVESIKENYPYYTNWLGKMGLESGKKKVLKSLKDMILHEDLR